MAGSLVGKVAIVTGAAGGIGSAYSRALAEAGASVVLADVNAEGVKTRTDELLAAGHQAMGIEIDIGDEASVRANVARVVAKLGGVDILVNNAALMAEIGYGTVSDIPVDLWRRVIDVNLTGALLCIQAVVPSMKERGGGKIVNQASAGAFIAGGVYGVSKLALVSLTVTLANELAPHKINVNAIAPGFVNTDAGLRATPDDMAGMRDMLAPLKGLGETSDLIGALMLLVTDAGSWITGQTLNVDGGWVMRI